MSDKVPQRSSPELPRNGDPDRAEDRGGEEQRPPAWTLLNSGDYRLYAKVFESVAEGIMILDADGHVQAVNPAYETMSGWSAAELVDRPCAILSDGLHSRDYIAGLLREHVSDSSAWRGEVHAARKDNDSFNAELSLSALCDDRGQATHYVAVMSDITQRKRDQEHIRFQASFDMLTHLPNRFLVADRLEQAVLHARRSGKRVALLYLGLDRFKQINESHGHAAGDDVLRQSAARLRKCVRISDTVGRLGGDEFMVVLANVDASDAGQLVADKILAAFSQPFRVGTFDLFSLPSIGLTYYPDDGENGKDLMRNADVAMYYAKSRGAERTVRFRPEMSKRSKALADMETDLRRALGRQELELFYQPKMGAMDQLIGAEALIRWNHTTKGRISPASFIPLAEESGVIVEMGHWILAEACGQLVEWDRQGLVLPSVSVNVSTRQFQDQQLIPTVSRCLEETGLDPKRLDLEITESVMTGDVDQAVSTLQELKALGVTLSIDDFGTGYSSLNYLKTFPIDTLKIDQSFVRDLLRSDRDAAIVSTIISLAHNLGFSVVAEGVETEEQAHTLMEMTCRRFQGYLFSAPLPAAEFEKTARAWEINHP